MSSEIAQLPALEEMREAGMSDEDIALRVWALECDRNIARTAQYLRDVFRLEINNNTLYTWKRRNDWDGQAVELFTNAAPHKLQRMAVRALNAAESSWSYLEDVAAGRAPTNEKGEIDKGRASVCLELVRIVGFVAPKPNDVSISGTSFQRAIGQGPTNNDAVVSASIEEIEAALRQRGIAIEH